MSMEEFPAAELELCEAPILHFFSQSHWEELLQLIKELHKCSSNENFEEIAKLERNFETFRKILDLYQEQPHLIDPKLQNFIDILLEEMRNWNSHGKKLLREQIFMFLCQIIKVRGYKIVVRYLPHEVGQLELVLGLLETENKEKRPHWETRYVLLIWLAIICKNPFDMYRFDVGTAVIPIRERIMEAGKSCLSVVDRSKEAAAVLLAEFLIRPDMKLVYLESELRKSIDLLKTLSTASNDETLRAWGLLLLISQIFKKGTREDLLEHSDLVLDGLCHCQFEKSSNSLLRKMMTKCIQRIGMVMLKPKIATWRYQRGSRSLMAKMGKNPEFNSVVNKLEEDDSEDYDIPEQIELIIGCLLRNLKDRDTVVRWSAAKGIGRIVARLPKELADEVLGSILGLFSAFEADSSWHGGCLAIAELGRRGLLLPSRLPDVTPLIVAGLNYEEQRGRFSVGTNVRDAACYVCWAFARAYQPQEFAPFVSKIAASLITTSLFDREVNCRRAASAAFQENVGRQGTFPNGIEILTLVDYFSVGVLTHSYLELGVKIAEFPEYTRPIIDHLLTCKINHGDVKIRKLAASALGLLVKVDLNYFIISVLSKLISSAKSDELFLRQGSILTIGEVTKAICHSSAINSIQIEDRFTVEISLLPSRIQQANQLKGIGGELMRDAINWLIERLGLSYPQFPRPENEMVRLWLKLLEDNLCHRDVNIRRGAAESLSSIGVYFGDSKSTDDFTELRDQMVSSFTKGLIDAPTEVHRMGMALGLSSLPTHILLMSISKIRKALLQAATSTSAKDKFWAEARRDVIGALAQITTNLFTNDPTNGSCSEENLLCLFNCFMLSLEDYTIDARGDIGTVVREAGMKALKKLAELVGKKSDIVTQFLSDDNRFFTMSLKILNQACEKIDRTRVIAAEVLRFFLVSPQFHQFPIPHRNSLHSIFQPEDVDTDGNMVNWSSATFSYSRLAQLLYYPEYIYDVLLGFIVSAGDSTESTSKYASDALLNYFQEIQENRPELDLALETIASIMERHRKVDRVSIAAMAAVDLILTSGYLEMIVGELMVPDGLHRILAATNQEISGSKNPKKMMAASRVWCGLLQFSNEPLRDGAMRELCQYLLHPYPRVRKAISQQLYESLLSNSGTFLDNHTESVMNILTNTDWDSTEELLKPIVTELMATFNLSL